MKHFGTTSGRVVIFGIICGAVYAAIYLICYQPAPDVNEYVKILDAAKVYQQELSSHGRPIPASVTLAELIAKGFLRPSNVPGFKTMEATVSLGPVREKPGEVLMRVRLPNGHEFTAFGDAHVDETSKSQF